MKNIQAPFLITPYLLLDDGRFPNNEHLPVLIYKKAIQPGFFFPLFFIKKRLKKNRWFNFWIAGIFTYHHYHSNTHELLVIYKGSTVLRFGGDNGISVNVSKGDIILIPAGVAHKNMGEENAVKCLGAYPHGKMYDMNYGNPGERPRADQIIRGIPIPECDPLLGKNGPLQQYWK